MINVDAVWQAGARAHARNCRDYESDKAWRLATCACA